MGEAWRAPVFGLSRRFLLVVEAGDCAATTPSVVIPNTAANTPAEMTFVFI